jgi:predicted secreted protein
MSRKLALAIAFLATLVTTTQAVAHDEPQTYDRIDFRVSAAREVDNDMLIAVMYYERNGQQPALLADDVNRTITWAVDLAKKRSDIKVQTLNYRQDPLYKNQTIAGWKVRQSIRLESTDATALSTLIGELQKRLSVASLQYTVSPDVRRSVEDELIVEALNRFGRRAELIAKELGRPDYRIVNVDIVTADDHPGPVRMRAVATMAESGSVRAPKLEAGVQSVTVKVSGTIELEVPR